MTDESLALLASPLSIGGAARPSNSARSSLRPRSPGSPSDAARTNIILTTVNLMNGLLGAGVIALPGALNRSGFVPGLLLCAAVAAMSDTTIRLLAALGSAYGCSTYEDLAVQAFGSSGFFIVSAFQLLFTIGAMASYLLIASDGLAGVVATLAPACTGPLCDRRLLLTLTAVSILLPLSLYRHFGRLAKFSLVKAACAVAVTAIIVACSTLVNTTSTRNATWRYVAPHNGFFPALGTVAFAFVSHHQTFLAYSSLQAPSLPRFATVIHSAVCGAFIISITFAAAGYVTFWEVTDGNIFNNYLSIPDLRDSALLSVARLLLSFNMLLTYPGDMLVARRSVEAIVLRRRRHRRWVAMRAPVHDTVALLALRDAEEKEAATGADAWTVEQGCTRALGEHVALTVGLFLITLAIALSTTDLNRVLDMSGSFAAVFLAFVLPAAIRLRLGVSPDDTLPLLHVSNVPAMCILAFGVFAFVTSTGFSLLSLVTGSDFMLGNDAPPSR